MENFVFLRIMNPCIAIIDQNTLSNVTLRSTEEFANLPSMKQISTNFSY